MKRFVRIGLILGAAMLLGFAGCKTQVEPTPEPTVLSFTGTPYTVLAKGTDGTLGTKGTYVLFGDWPQTVKADSVTVDETNSVVMGAYTYYKGSDGAWYAKLSDEYFKVEPIKWRILTDDYSGKKLLLAENALINCTYCYYGDVNRNGGIYPNNYRESMVRAYLNGLSYSVKESNEAEQKTNKEFLGKGFLQTAFTEATQKMIAETDVDNSGDSTTDAAGKQSKSDGTDPEYPTDYTCVNTKDKIFLMSEKEVTTAEYGFADYDVYIDDGNGTKESSRIRMTTDYVKARCSAWQEIEEGYGGRWWLRSPYYEIVSPSGMEIGFYTAQAVYMDGSAGFCFVNDDWSCVVPALCLEN